MLPQPTTRIEVLMGFDCYLPRKPVAIRWLLFFEQRIIESRKSGAAREARKQTVMRKPEYATAALLDSAGFQANRVRQGFCWRDAQWVARSVHLSVTQLSLVRWPWYWRNARTT